MARSIALAFAAEAKSRTRRSSRPAMRGVPRGRGAISLAPSFVMPVFRTRAARLAICSSSGLGIKIQPHRNAEPVAQWIGQETGAGGGADQGELCKFDLHRARGGAFADD